MFWFLPSKLLPSTVNKEDEDDCSKWSTSTSSENKNWTERDCMHVEENISPVNDPVEDEVNTNNIATPLRDRESYKLQNSELLLHPVPFGTSENDIDDDSRKFYDKKEKENLMKYCLSKALFVGKKGAGKSSLVKTLKENCKSKMNENDRTHLMNHHNWTPIELNLDKKKHAVMIVDFGGHSIYENTSKFFISDNDKNLAVVAHKIIDYDYDTCITWVNNLVYTSPKCQVIFALTQIDLLTQYEKQRSYEDKCSSFKKEMKIRIDEEIKKVKLRILSSRKTKFSKQKENQEIINTLESIKEGISAERNSQKQRVFLVCCNDKAEGIGMDDESLEFRNFITQMCKHRYVEMTSICQYLYVELGKIGITKDNRYEETHSMERQVPKDWTDESWTEQSFNTGVAHIDMTEAENAYQRIQCRSQEKESLVDCLRKLHSLGLLYWYEYTHMTKQVIFNDIPAFVDMMRSLFDHKLEEKGIVWSSLSEEQKMTFSSESHYNIHHKEKLLSSGILSKDLLEVLLKRYDIEQYLQNILEMLCHLKITYRINNNETFFPWYLKNLNLSCERTNIEQAIGWIIHSDKSSLSRCLQFSGHIPKSTFYSLNVLLYDKLGLQSVVHNKYFWTNGMFVHMGSIALALVYNGNDRIYAFVKGNCETKCPAIRDIWKLLKFVNCSMEEILKRDMPEALEKCKLLCTVCISINSRSDFNRHIIDTIKGKESYFSPAYMTCGIFDDEVTMSNDVTPLLDMDGCCGRTDSILFLPPVPYENLDGTTSMDNDGLSIFSHLKNALDIFPEKNSGKFELGTRCLISLTTQHDKASEKDGSALYGLQYVAKLTEEDMFETAPFFRTAICHLHWPKSLTLTGHGTGFLLGSVNFNQQRCFLVLTCRHLLTKGLCSAVHKNSICSSATAEFKFDFKTDSKVKVKVSHVCGQNESLDYAILCLHPDIILDHQFRNNSVLSTLIPALKFATDKNVRLTLMGHPLPDCSKLTIDDAIVDKNYFIKACFHSPCFQECSSRLVYKCSSFEGASGSPIIHLPTRRIYALHSSGDIRKDHILPNVDDIRDGNEYGVLLYDIVFDIYGKVISGEFSDINENDYFVLFPDFQDVVRHKKSFKSKNRLYQANKPYVCVKKRN